MPNTLVPSTSGLSKYESQNLAGLELSKPDVSMNESQNLSELVARKFESQNLFGLVERKYESQSPC